MFSNEFRINYYLNDLKSLIINVTEEEFTFDYEYFTFDKINVLNYDFLEKNKHTNPYLKDFFNYINFSSNNKGYFTCSLNDYVCDYNYPIFAKARKIGKGNRILLNLDSDCHTKMLSIIKNIDIPFDEKKNTLLWRGSSTGNVRHMLRESLVKQFQNHTNPNIDIKFTKLVQGYTNDNDEYIIADNMSYQEQLKSKFIISIEGNDVATNLKWLLLSNSVVLMPTPTVCSWFMEDCLKPYVHYIPISSDFTDLESQYQWCLENLNTCECISKNATEYIEQFLDSAKEEEITKTVIDTYFDKVTLNISNETL
jgi:hypothetical protein